MPKDFPVSPIVIPLSGTELLDHLTLQAGKSIYWTVPVEFKYYLVLPFVAAGFALLLRRHLAWSLGGVVAVLAVLHWLWPARESRLNTVELLPYLPIFLLGSLAAFVHWKIQQRGGINSPALRAASRSWLWPVFSVSSASFQVFGTRFRAGT